MEHSLEFGGEVGQGTQPGHLGTAPDTQGP